jgi:hypothetical protein
MPSIHSLIFEMHGRTWIVDIPAWMKREPGFYLDPHFKRVVEATMRREVEQARARRQRRKNK